MRRLVFVHGGPGLNSREEARILGPMFASRGVHARFWDEPSSQRPEAFPFSPDGAFGNAVDSLERFLGTSPPSVTVVCHSFGVHVVIALLGRGVRVDRIIAVAPTLPEFSVFLSMMRLACHDFRANAPDIATRLEALVDETRYFFDGAMQQGLQLVVQDPVLLQHYWQSAEAMAAYAASLSRPGSVFDPAAFFAVLAGHASNPPPVLDGTARDTPVTAVFGESDPIVDRAAAVETLRGCFAHVDVVTFAASGHAPHLERPAELVRIALRRDFRTPASRRPARLADPSPR